jgi:SnoaL-like domain
MSTAPTAQLPLRAAIEAGDLEAAVACFAPDAVVRSPLTDSLAFRGHDQIRAILGVVLATFDGIHYTAEAREGETALLVSQAHVAGQAIEIADHIRLDADGLIREFTVFFRPLPAAAAALRVLGTGLARRRSPVRAGVISALAAPLAFLARTGDKVGTRLVAPTL